MRLCFEYRRAFNAARWKDAINEFQFVRVYVLNRYERLVLAIMGERILQ